MADLYLCTLTEAQLAGLTEAEEDVLLICQADEVVDGVDIITDNNGLRVTFLTYKDSNPDSVSIRVGSPIPTRSPRVNPDRKSRQSWL